MIKSIFFDLDECLIHSALYEPKQKHFRFTLEDYGGTYYTIVRPCAKRVIKFAQELIGKENVYILTAAVQEYAQEINALAELGIKRENILSREDINSHRYATAYGGSCVTASKYASLDNILIDNLDPRDNESKIDFLGMWRSVDTNYLWVKDYYGVNKIQDSFEETVIEFLEERHKAPSLCKQVGEEKMEIPSS